MPACIMCLEPDMAGLYMKSAEVEALSGQAEAQQWGSCLQLAHQRAKVMLAGSHGNT